jgi:hypothetical protein
MANRATTTNVNYSRAGSHHVRIRTVRAPTGIVHVGAHSHVCMGRFGEDESIGTIVGQLRNTLRPARREWQGSSEFKWSVPTNDVDGLANHGVYT